MGRLRAYLRRISFARMERRRDGGAALCIESIQYHWSRRTYPGERGGLEEGEMLVPCVGRFMPQGAGVTTSELSFELSGCEPTAHSQWVRVYLPDGLSHSVLPLPLARLVPRSAARSPCEPIRASRIFPPRPIPSPSTLPSPCGRRRITARIPPITVSRRAPLTQGWAHPVNPLISPLNAASRIL
jgi:hypothetical protein